LKHILLVTYNWPPRNAIGTNRPYSWAKHLRKAGYSVTVLTASKQSFDEPLDLSLPTLANTEIIEVPYVLNLLGGTDKLAKPLLGYAKKIFWRIKGILPLEVDPRRGWRVASMPVVKELAHRVDCVISTYGPSAAHLIAYDIKTLNPAVKWIADYRDLWSCNPVSRPNKIQSTLSFLREKATVMKSADYITVVSSDMSSVIASRFGRVSVVIPNGFDEDVESVEARLMCASPRSAHREFRFVYTGTIYPGSQDPYPLLRTLAHLRRSDRLIKPIIIEFYGSRLDSLQKLASDPRFKDFIRIMGHVSREQALDAQRSADALLLLESSAPSARGVITGKIFEYITTGVPILCIGSDPEYEIGQLLATTRTGIVCGSRQLNDLPDLISESLLGRGIYACYDPQIDAIMQYSRTKLADAMTSLV
jgi:glycosyltransferase involved in cell wall biosynthesis